LDEIILYSEFVYFKFYFDEYIDDEIVNHLRVDIGDGIKNNLWYYEYSEESMGWSLELKSKKIERANESFSFYALDDSTREALQFS
jgi:hypothetical protein